MWTSTSRPTSAPTPSPTRPTLQTPLQRLPRSCPPGGTSPGCARLCRAGPDCSNAHLVLNLNNTPALCSGVKPGLHSPSMCCVAVALVEVQGAVTPPFRRYLCAHNCWTYAVFDCQIGTRRLRMLVTDVLHSPCTQRRLLSRTGDEEYEQLKSRPDFRRLGCRTA